MIGELHPDPWLRPSQAAKRLGITLQTLRAWIDKGAINYSEVGPSKTKRLKQSDVDRLRRDYVRHDSHG